MMRQILLLTADTAAIRSDHRQHPDISQAQQAGLGPLGDSLDDFKGVKPSGSINCASTPGVA